MASETARIEAFSDGVFAIAITLLILEIKVPQPAAGPLALQLARQWPSYISYVISFSFIGIMWINHHRLFNHIRRSNHGLMIYNMLLLLGVTFVPYPTSVLAAFLGKPDQRLAAMFYNGTYFFIAVFFNLLWRHAKSGKDRLFGNEVDPAAIELIDRRYAIGLSAYALCAALAWWSVAASLILNVAMALFFALPHTAVRAAHD
ncbi:MAG TPA: TMEM175 family protein [Terriglobales bacterium]|nr:TMEM175 family protein [Terriglobales bacterium]